MSPYSHLITIVPDKPYTITVKNKQVSFAPNDSNVLTVLEQHKINAPYQCREGFCGACRAKCQGKVYYPHEPLAFIREGEILLCCAVPESDLIIDI